MSSNCRAGGKWHRSCSFSLLTQKQAMRSRAKIPVCLLLLLVSWPLIAAQGPGNGISKCTWAVTDPIAALSWLKTYLPSVRDAGDSCRNNQCSKFNMTYPSTRHSPRANPPPSPAPTRTGPSRSLGWRVVVMRAECGQQGRVYIPATSPPPPRANGATDRSTHRL